MVRVGYLGVGGIGTAHVENLLKIPGAEIRAVCDIVSARVERTQQLCLDAVVLSAITELSGRSIAQNGEPMAFPDFTDGGWQNERVLPVMHPHEQRWARILQTNGNAKHRVRGRHVVITQKILRMLLPHSIDQS